MSGKQTQKSGDNSSQIQAGVVIVNNGITEERARVICEEQLKIALKDYSDEAKKTASERSAKFETVLIEKMVREKSLEAFADPAFQFLLIGAQKSAASTERQPDYELLSELMIHRFTKATDRVVRAGVTRAVEIVDQISDEALLAITVFHSVSYFVPMGGDINTGLKLLDDLYGKIIYDILPENDIWLDHLDILDAARISTMGGTKLLEDFWYDQLDGLLKNGIAENSDKHILAKQILESAGMSSFILIKNTFNDKFVRLPVSRAEFVSDLPVITNAGIRRCMENDIRIYKKVYDMYDGSKMSKEEFISMIEQYQHLKTLRTWWNKLSEKSIKITSVGRVLAHSNAQRIDKNLPPLN